ncbi:MAG: 3-deoxy-7-phosphoheptulonate synthase [Planctomycetes bacterium]|nr:3-deoxy-7-phosphoheptulonate synthase [Planctomycetota bacterium]
MIVVMQHGASEPQIQHVIERIRQLGLTEHLSRGEFRTVIGAVGDKRPEHQTILEAIDGVEQVVPIMKPYKLASREFHPVDSQVDVGGVTIGGGGVVLIAGPCAVENRQSLHTIAEAARAGGAAILRGGAFKPRTSPYSFQGLGLDGLKMLREVGDEFGMPVVTEVVAVKDVELVARYADMIQIGARNVQNFNLLSEVGMTGKPVFLKRGFATTIGEYLMSAEYVLSQGNRKLVLCERGIKTFETELRFTFDVSAVPVIKHNTHLPIFVDPSHACGRREFVTALALAGVAAGADGVMVEIHNCPEEAMCDGPQALLPEMFADLARRLADVAKAVGKELVPPGPRGRAGGKDHGERGAQIN